MRCHKIRVKPSSIFLLAPDAAAVELLRIYMMNRRTKFITAALIWNYYVFDSIGYMLRHLKSCYNKGRQNVPAVITSLSRNDQWMPTMQFYIIFNASHHIHISTGALPNTGCSYNLYWHGQSWVGTPEWQVQFLDVVNV